MSDAVKVKKARVANKCVVMCTDTNHKVKAQLVSKSESELVLDLPTGFQMTLTKITQKHKLYVYRVGMLEFVSDGWLQP